MVWWDEARCQRLDDELVEALFFGTENATGALRRTPEAVEYAKAVCGLCSAREACLLDALAVPPKYDTAGIRGGLLPKERRALRFEWKVTTKDGAEWVGGPPGRRRSQTV